MKVQRIELTQKREQSSNSLESKEGITYASNIAFELDAAFIHLITFPHYPSTIAK